MFATMPKVDAAIAAANFNAEELAIAKQIIGRGGVLRSSKPKDGTAAYVWRMVAFNISPMGVHHCMPVTADFGLPEWNIPREEGRHEKVRARCKELDVLVDRIVKQVPKDQWHGINRWGRAMGVGRTTGIHP